MNNISYKKTNDVSFIKNILNEPTSNEIYDLQNSLEIVHIQTNNLCTRKCSFCYFGNIQEKQNMSELNTRTVYSILDQLGGIDFSGRLSLFGINEPLIDKRMVEFVSYAHRVIPNAWQMMVTNGDLLTHELVKRLVDAGLNRIYVSIYEHNMTLKIGKMQSFLDKYTTNLISMDFINYKFEDNRGGNVSHLPPQSEPLEIPCERIHKILIIRPNGDVVPCNGDFYSENIMGNVKNERIMDIWNGKKFQQFREILDKKDRTCFPLCSKCNYRGKGGYFKTER